MRPLHTGFAVSVDLVVLTVVKGTLCALLFTRDSQPYQGRPALPGNFVAHDEDLASAAWRRLNAETGLSSTQVHLEQLASYGSIDRDPRGRVVTIGYLALLPSASIPRQKPSGAVARWNPVEPLLEEATALLVLGSSLTVQSGLRFVRAAGRAGTPVVILNDGPTRADPVATVRVHGRLEDLLERWLSRAGARR